MFEPTAKIAIQPRGPSGDSGSTTTCRPSIIDSPARRDHAPHAPSTPNSIAQSMTDDRSGSRSISPPKVRSIRLAGIDTLRRDEAIAAILALAHRKPGVASEDEINQWIKTRRTW
jgi:hypothetical protein